MNIKMIVTDLDGTLLRRDKTISDYTASVFRRCRDRGMKIVFATARPVRAVANWLKLDIIFDACIYHNGAVVKIGDELFRETGIGCDVYGKLIDSVKQLKQIKQFKQFSQFSQFNDIKIAVEINDVLYANFDAATIWPGVEYEISDLCGLPELPADKIIFITADMAEINEIERLLDDNLYWDISENEVLMVMHKNARKRNAVADLATYFGISLAETAAFGDDYNDIEMLRACGVGVSVANAIDEAKDAADFICGANEDDGVAKWIEAHMFY